MEADLSPRPRWFWYVMLCVGGLMGMALTTCIPLTSSLAQFGWPPRYLMATIAQIIFAYAMVNWSERGGARVLAFLLPGVVMALAQHGKPFSPIFVASQVGVWLVCTLISFWRFRRRRV